MAINLPTCWNLAPPPGFQGLREDLPLDVYEQVLPHWRQDGATYFVTFRLHDSLPQSKLNELRLFKEEAQRRIASLEPKSSRRVREETVREIIRRTEVWLDEGMGTCCLRSSDAVAKVRDALHSADGARYELNCYVIMPNHVHAVLRPLHSATDPLESILQSWKGSSARLINELMGRTGALWQRDTFDRIARDEEHLWRILQYIGRNPAKAGLTARDTSLWIRPDWVELGWRFDEKLRVD